MPATFAQVSAVDSYPKIMHFLEAHPEHWLFLQHVPESLQKKAIASAVAVNIFLKELHEQMQLQAALANLAQEQKAKLEELAKKIKEIEQNRNPAQAEKLAQLKDIYKTTSQSLAQITEQFAQFNIKLANIQTDIAVIEQAIRQEIARYKEKALNIEERAEESIKNLVATIFADPATQQDLELITANLPNFKAQAPQLVKNAANNLMSGQQNEATLERIVRSSPELSGADAANFKQHQARRSLMLAELRPVAAAYEQVGIGEIVPAANTATAQASVKPSRVLAARRMAPAVAGAVKVLAERDKEQARNDAWLLEILAQKKQKLVHERGIMTDNIMTLACQKERLEKLSTQIDLLSRALSTLGLTVKVRPHKEQIKEIEMQMEKTFTNIEKIKAQEESIAVAISDLLKHSVFKQPLYHNSASVPASQQAFQFVPKV